MTAGWVAASNRGRALLGHLVGRAGARAIAAAASWPDALTVLGPTMYGREATATGLATDDRGAARLAAATATAWQLRVLSGWLPPAAGGLARLSVGPLELSNIEHHLAHLAGDGPAAAVPLGSLGVAWPRIARADSPEQVRSLLARSAWGDPGGTDRVTVGVGLRIALARRIVRQAPDAATWARGATSVLVARERFAFGRQIATVTGHEVDALIGTRWRRATTIGDLAELLPDSASWPLAEVASPRDLWTAERAVVRRVDLDATRLAASGRSGRATVMAIMALILVDLWRVDQAISAAGLVPVEVFDDVA